MIKNENFSDIPVDLRTTPWLERLLTLFQEQAQTIQKQAEQIISLKQTVQELRDEVNRLKNVTKFFRRINNLVGVEGFGRKFTGNIERKSVAAWQRCYTPGLTLILPNFFTE
jgi:hypothetical protein